MKFLCCCWLDEKHLGICKCWIFRPLPWAFCAGFGNIRKVWEWQEYQLLDSSQALIWAKYWANQPYLTEKFHQIPTAPVNLKLTRVIYKVPVWEILVLDLVAWFLPMFCLLLLLLLKLECKNPMKNGAFYPCACFVINSQSLCCVPGVNAQVLSSRLSTLRNTSGKSWPIVNDLWPIFSHSCKTEENE